MSPVRNYRSVLLPRILVLVFIVIGLFIALAGRFGIFQPARSTANATAAQAALASGNAISQGERGALVATATPLPSPTSTPMPTPTATPVPAPIKTGDAAAPAVSAVSAVVLDDDSGAVLYSKNPHLQRAPASITKIVTAIVAIEHGKLDDMVTVKYDPSELVDSTVMGVNPGDKCTFEDLLYGLMLPSGNDAAIAIANYIAGSEEAFAGMMNAKMAELGLKDSHFVNAHGLDAKGHYTSAYDMAMVARYAMRNATFRALAAARYHTVTVQTPNGIKRYDVYNLNKLLTTYKGADGVKLGYTDNALRTIVASATRNGHRVFVSLMGSTDLWTDSAPMLDWAFKNFSWPDSQPH